MFLELWDYILKTESDYTFYRATSMEKHRLQEKIYADEKGFVQPYTDSPLDHEDVGENVYLNMLSRAKKYLYIFTPYRVRDAHGTCKCGKIRSGCASGCTGNSG